MVQTRDQGQVLDNIDNHRKTLKQLNYLTSIILVEYNDRLCIPCLYTSLGCCSEFLGTVPCKIFLFFCQPDLQFEWSLRMEQIDTHVTSGFSKKTLRPKFPTIPSPNYGV